MSDPTITQAQQPAAITTIALAGRVARDVELQSVLLRQASVASAFEPTEEEPVLGVTQQHRHSYDVSYSSHRLLVTIGFSLQLQAEGGEKPALSLLADYRLDYSLPSEKEYTDQELRYFAELNGTLNAWPFWRELVNSVAGRVGLGGITVPLFRIKSEKVELETGTPNAEAQIAAAPGAA